MDVAQIVSLFWLFVQFLWAILPAPSNKKYHWMDAEFVEYCYSWQIKKKKGSNNHEDNWGLVPPLSPF